MMHHRDSISWKYFLLAWPSYIIEVLYKHLQEEICGFEYMGYTSQREIHGITAYGVILKPCGKVHVSPQGGRGGYWCCPRGPNILGFLGAFFEYKKFFLFFDIFANRTFSTFCAYCGYSSRFQQ